MTPEEEITTEIWKLLKKIQKERLLTNGDACTRPYSDLALLRKLENEGAINIQVINLFSEVWSGRMGMVDNTGKFTMPSPLSVEIKVKLFKRRFDVVYNIYQKKAAAIEKANLASGFAKVDPFLFYLSRSTGLYRVFQNDTETYPVHRAKQRFQILSNLTKSFQRTEQLAQEIRTAAGRLRAQIVGIREQVEQHFVGIRGKDFIEGEQGLGYRIGEKITLKKRE